MNYTVSITSKGQMTIPKEIRDQLGLQAPSRVVVQANKDKSLTIRKPVALKDLHKLLGKPTGRPKLTEREKLFVPYLVKKYVKKPD